MARKTKDEEISIILGPLFLDLCQFLAERGTPLGMGEMAALMTRMEKKAGELAAAGGMEGRNGIAP